MHLRAHQSLSSHLSLSSFCILQGQMKRAEHDAHKSKITSATTKPFEKSPDKLIPLAKTIFAFCTKVLLQPQINKTNKQRNKNLQKCFTYNPEEKYCSIWQTRVPTCRIHFSWTQLPGGTPATKEKPAVWGVRTAGRSAVDLSCTYPKIARTLRSMRSQCLRNINGVAQVLCVIHAHRQNWMCYLTNKTLLWLEPTEHK